MVEAVYFCCEFLFTAVKVWFTLRLARALWEPRWEDRVQNVLWVGVAIVIAGFNAYNNWLISMLYSKLVMEIWVLLLSCVSRILYHCRYRDAFCLIYLFWTVLALADFFFQTLVYTGLDFLGFQRDILLTVTIARAVYQMLWAVILVKVMKPVCQWVQQRKREVVRSLKWGWFLVPLLLLCMIYFQRVYIQVVSEALMYRWWLFLLGSMLLVVVLLAYLVMQRERGNYQALQLRTEMLEKEYQILQRDYEEKRVLQHDLGKHIQAAREMVGVGKGQEAFGYLDAMVAELRKDGNRNLANHDLVNLILNTKEREAGKSGISVRYEVEDMNGLQLEPAEIVALFSNILDNAIEANQALAEVEQRWISFSCTRKGQMLVLSISNAKAGGTLKFMGGVPRTTKADKKSHGIGMQSIQQVVGRYEGHMKFEVEEDTFSQIVYMKGFR